LLDNTGAVERFRREFRAAARLAHPNVVTAFDADQAGNLHFLVMEFVEGLSFDRLVAQTGPLSVAQACHFIRQAAIGLVHVHEQGMIHRDIKPQNLMVMRKGQVKILDCGLARIVQAVAPEPAASGAASGPEATSAGMILGTPDYIAPEQVNDPRSADIRADIYSLGCTLYFLLAGRPPFPHGTITDKLVAQASAEPPPLSQFRSDVPPGLSRVLARMLAKDPRERYATPGEVARDLAPFAGERAGEQAAPSAGEPPPPPLVAPVAAEAPTTAEPFAGLTLASTPPPGKPAASGSFPKIGPLAIVAAILACGVALAMMVLAFPLAGWLFHRSAATAEPVPNVRPSTLPATAPAALAVTPVGKLPRRVLFLLPKDALWPADYRDVRKNLPTDIEVVAAGTTLEPVKFHTGANVPQQLVKADVLLKDVRAADYGAIVFAGYSSEEFAPGGAGGEQARRLINECKQQGRLITSICRGQLALLEHGELRHKTVAYCFYCKEQYPSHELNLRPTSVERDGQLITAGRDTDAKAFAETIAAALNESPGATP
ncbi:MAG TPA: protein kinase, partial [Pirellulaceae bacterium]|nr:protein kinase [Pirellulaceae bacterium]